MGVFLTTAYRTYIVGLVLFVVSAKIIEFVEVCKKDEKIMKFVNGLKKDFSFIRFQKREGKDV